MTDSKTGYELRLFFQSKTGKKVLILLAFILVIAIFYLAGGHRWLNLENLQENRDYLINLTERHYGLMFLGWGLLYCISTALSVPGGAVLSLATGLLFGRWMGTLLVVIWGTLGATLVFLAARYLFADEARERLEKKPAAAKLIRGFHEDEFNYLLFLRLVPLFPFWLVNLAPAFTPMSLRNYVLATALGVIPGSFVYVNLGQSLGTIESTEQLLSPGVIFALFLLGLFALLPVLIKKYKGGLFPAKKE